MVYLARGKTERAKSKAETAGALAGLGAGIGAVGGPVGAAVGGGIGAITGLIIGDNETVFPLDMVAIPAYQAYMIDDQPAFVVYIRAGETLVPTGGNVADMEAGAPASSADKPLTDQPQAKRKMSAYQRRYKAAFKKVKAKFKKKNGTWKKNGFKAAVRAAHQIARGGK